MEAEKMNQNNRLTRPNGSLDYVPYFYESGLVHRYLASQSNALHSPTTPAAPTYDFTSDLTQKTRFYHPPTVEQIIASGYFAVPREDPVMALISDKKNTSWLGLDNIIGQVRSRYELYHRNIYELELAKCAAMNSVHDHEAHHGPADSRIEYSLNKRLDGLYRDQRDERLTLWQDISKLKLLLPENAQQYLAAYRKSSILEDSKGDAS